MHAFRRALLVHTLASEGGNVSRAARALELQRTYVWRLLREYGLHGRGPHAPATRQEETR